MVIETAMAAVAAEVAAESIAEAAVVEAAEATVAEGIFESSISGATELGETLSAIQKEVPREIINERVEAILQDEAFLAKIANEVPQREINEVSQVEANRISGAEREKVVDGELKDKYPDDHIERECYLRDAEGHIVRDSETGEARRIDFAVIKDGEVIKPVEVTSETADKTAQLAKEDRIREAGGNYVEDRRTGEIVPFAHSVKTEVVRRI